MNIGLIGYGKMGKAIEEIALERGHTILFKADSSRPVQREDLRKADVAIEFTRPDQVLSNIFTVLDEQIPLVVGTTGWNDHLDSVKQKVSDTNGSLLYASNFSIGVNILFQVNEQLAKLMSRYPEYQINIEEIHHTQKLDSPSGTAITLANGILDNNESYISWVCEEGNPPHTTTGQLGVTAYRRPDVPGTHTIKYDSDVDTITVTHTAKSRKGFALGAVIAAEWIFNKKGVYTMKDILQ